MTTNEIDKKYIYQLISNNIKRLRSLHTISQLSLASNTGLTHNFINDIEHCKKGVSAETLAKLANFFKVEPYQFFLPEDMPNDRAKIYIKSFNDSMQKMISDKTQQYLDEE